MSKCAFGLEELEFLGHVISKKGIYTNPKKINTILSWPIPMTLMELQMFLGLANYYH